MADVKAPQNPTTGSEPPTPYIDKSGCPFECCTYRDWTANVEESLRNSVRVSFLGVLRETSSAQFASNVTRGFVVPWHGEVESKKRQVRGPETGGHMRVRLMALFAGIVVLASCVAAKKKEKQVLPDTVLRAQTVFVVIQPDAKEPLTEPNANLKAQKAVEEALIKWGKFRLAVDTTADIVISVEKGTGKAMSPTISGGPVDSRPVDVEGDASQIRIVGQKGRPDTTSIPPNDPVPNARTQTGNPDPNARDVLRLFIGGAVEYPLDYAPVWMYSRKDALKGPEMAAVAELKKVFEESEGVAAEREKQKQQPPQAKNTY